MKSFPTAFVAEKNKKRGIKPVWILKITVNAVDYFITGKALTIPAFTGSTPWPASTVVNTKAWAKSWGNLQEGITNYLAEFKIANFGMDLLIYPDETPNIYTLVTQYNVEESPTQLYLWFDGISDPPQLMFQGYIKDVSISQNTTVSLDIQDETIKLERLFIGKKLSATDYPDAAEADIGKLIPLPFGTIEKSPTLAFDIGKQTLLTANCTAGATTLYFSNTDGFFTGMILLIDSEKVYVSTVSGLHATVTRGYSSTTAVKHSKGAAVVELTTQTYILSERALTAISRVWLRVSDELQFDISAYCTSYIGTGASGCPGYDLPGMQLSPANILDILEIIQLKQTDTIAVDTGSHDHASESSREQIATNQGVTYGGAGYNTVSFYPAYSSVSGTEIEETNHYVFSYGGDGNVKAVYVNGVLLENSLAANDNFVWSGTTAATPQIYVTNGSTNVWVKLISAYRSIAFYADTSAGPATGVAKTGEVLMTGSALTSYFGSGKIFADITADGGSLSGIATWLLDKAGYGAPTVTVDRTMNGAITEYKTALYWLNYLALQAPAWFKMTRGGSYYIPRYSTAVASQKTIPTCKITKDGRLTISSQKSATSEVLNKINLMSDLDYSKSRGVTSYRSNIKAEDAASQAVYGLQEQPSLFYFDFISNQLAATILLIFYLAKYKERHWIHTFDVFLDHCEIEFADYITLGFLPGDPIAQVLRAEYYPGDVSKIDTMKLTVLV